VAAVGVCCQKVSEAEVFARGGIKDILVSNQVRDPAKIDRLARLPKLGSADSSSASMTWPMWPTCRRRRKARHAAGVSSWRLTAAPAAAASRPPKRWCHRQAVDAAPGLKFTGIQAYQGAMQHMDRYEDRKAKLDAAIAQVKDAVAALEGRAEAGTGLGRVARDPTISKANSGVYNELQCGSYAFMDADYGRIRDKDGKRIDQGEWENALFILTSVMSHAKADKADRRCRPEGAIGRQWPASRLRARRREIRQVLR
jgi:3-hydroxy-D-aspartate aldolase